MIIYHVTYWDPCNGMGGRSESRGHFATEALAQKFINDRVGEPGSLKRMSPNNWDSDAYRIHPIEVITGPEPGAPTVLDELRQYLPAT